jgi:transposase-like protein
MAKQSPRAKLRQRRRYSEDFKHEAVQMLLDGNSKKSCAAWSENATS